MCDELTTTPIPSPSVQLWGRGRKSVKLSPGKREGWGVEDEFKIWFYFSLSYSDLIGDKLNFPPPVNSILSVMVTGE